MPSTRAEDAMNRPAESSSVASICLTLRTHLERERDRIGEEIRNYPPPIPACDLQFNQLLEARAGISRELDLLQRLARESSRRSDAVGLLGEFIRSSSFLDDEAKRRLAAGLDETLAAHES
jgi:hypothetical protein